MRHQDIAPHTNNNQSSELSTIMRASLDDRHLFELEFRNGMKTLYRIVSHDVEGNDGRVL